MILYIFHQKSSRDFISLHFTTLHSPLFTSLHFWAFRHYSSKPFTFPYFCLKLYDLQEKVVRVSADSWFHSWTLLFTNEYLPISVLRYLALFIRSYQPVSDSYSYSFPCHLLVCALKRGQT
jgi:hypothetical protein